MDLIAYKDRDIVVGAVHAKNVAARSRDAYAHLLVIDGRLAGIWRRTLRPHSVDVDVVAYRRLTRADTRGIAAAVSRYGRFLNRPATLSIS